jgi:hypothetical protein
VKSLSRTTGAGWRAAAAAILASSWAAVAGAAGGADRAHRHPERLGGLGVVQAGPHAQGEHVSLGAAQGAEGGVDLLQPFGIIDTAGQVVGEVRDVGRLRQPVHRRLLAAGRPGDVAGHVEGDAEQPGSQRAAVRPHRAAQPPGLEKRERHHLFRGRPVAGQPERVVVDGAGVLAEQHAELVMVSGAHPGALTQLHALLCPARVIEFPVPGARR